MQNGPTISHIAAVLGDPARATMLAALMDYPALAAGELARVAGVSRSTASQHLSLMIDNGLLLVEQQGRHRYYRLANVDVASAFEALAALSEATGARRIRPGPKEARLRFARICYDHLAGECGVRLLSSLIERDYITSCPAPTLTAAGREFVTGFGIDLASLAARPRTLCRYCLDWSERRHHLSGALGASFVDLMIDKRWMHRRDGRIIEFSPQGLPAFQAAFPVRAVAPKRT